MNFFIKKKYANNYNLNSYSLLLALCRRFFCSVKTILPVKAAYAGQRRAAIYRPHKVFVIRFFQGTAAGEISRQVNDKAPEARFFQKRDFINNGKWLLGENG